ncbi:MAG: gamma carbonic anhydrase family protein, partial [Fidelibacterota bacterium]
EVTVGHNALIHGCTVEDKCLIGMGAILLDDSVVGSGSIVGAGALVPPRMIIPPRSLCLGVPAKIIRQVTDKEYQENIESAQHYIDFAAHYKNLS